MKSKMKNKLRKLGTFILTMIVIVCLIPVSAFAAGYIDTEKTVSLELSYEHNDHRFENLNVKLYRVADVSSDGFYTPAESFSKYQVKLNDVMESAEWNETAATLAAYVTADSITPYQSAVTDANGTIALSGMTTGMYLITSDESVIDGSRYIFAPFLISAPGLDENDQWVYDVTSSPKCEVVTPPADDKEVEYKVVKLWNESNYQKVRPESITVEILKNGVKFSEQTLSANNNWTYTWKAPNSSDVWQAVERNVPASYTVKISQSNNIITITNTLNGSATSNTKPPYTGDDTNLTMYILLIVVCGAGLIIIGIMKSRKDEPYEEK